MINEDIDDDVMNIFTVLKYLHATFRIFILFDFKTIYFLHSMNKNFSFDAAKLDEDIKKFSN